MASYDYSPLNRTTRSIRLLQFEEPPPGSDVVCCSLETYDLDSCPPFAALSYVWGEAPSTPSEGPSIFLDWAEFPVRQNLHAALCAIRHFEREDQLWLKTSAALTDFTSRQTNLPQLMATLKRYTPENRWQAVIHKIVNTPCVMVTGSGHRHDQDQRLQAFWGIFETIVGCDESTGTNLNGDSLVIADWRHRYYWIDAICINQQDDAERGHQVNFMGDIYCRADCVIAWLGPETAASDRAMRAIANGAFGRAAGEERTPVEGALEDISDRPYWQRLWTAQEFILARDVVLVCGRQKVLGTYQGVFIPIWYLWDDHLQAVETIPMLNRIDARIWWLQQRVSSLEELMEQFRSAHCSDPRDRVYALLSLLRDESHGFPRLEPDYTISERELYYRVLCYRRRWRLAHNWRYESKELRGELREALGIPEDESFKKNDFLYEITGLGRLAWPEDSIIESHHELLNSLTNLNDNYSPRLPNPEIEGNRDPREVYQDIIRMFSEFPKAEDPLTWKSFDQLLRKRLVLEVKEEG